MRLPRLLTAAAVTAALALPSGAAAVCTTCQSVAVASIDSEVNCNYYESYWGTFLVIECRKKFNEMREMIETAIRNTNKFSVFERARLYTLLDERALAQVGITGGGSYRTRLKGVDFLIYGKITEFSRGANSYAENSFAMNSTDAALAIDLKIVNVRSGQIIFASNVREELQTSSGVSTGSSRQGTAMDAARTAGLLQRQVAQAIAQELTFQGYPPSIAQIEGSRIYINYGTPFLKQGMTVNVFSLGTPLIDPQTGAQIGRTEMPAGSYRVEQVASGYSVASLISPGPAQPRKGDLVRFERLDANGAEQFERVDLPRN
ncbi:hypothetical protein IP88_08285 [alpha proteobacterium AAP81b]|nr:hypothetical protein IP88_08285 [alpha proteobacterium AAP81b]